MRFIKNSVFLPVLLMGLIFAESSIPMDGGSDDIAFLTSLNPAVQNLLHIPLYGLLAFLWMNVFKKKGFRPALSLTLSLLIAVLYGCLDEVHQAFVPGRYGGLLDVCLNTAGALLGVWVYSRVLPFPGKTAGDL